MFHFPCPSPFTKHLVVLALVSIAGITVLMIRCVDGRRDWTQHVPSPTNINSPSDTGDLNSKFIPDSSQQPSLNRYARSRTQLSTRGQGLDQQPSNAVETENPTDSSAPSKIVSQRSTAFSPYRNKAAQEKARLTSTADNEISWKSLSDAAEKYKGLPGPGPVAPGFDSFTFLQGKSRNKEHPLIEGRYDLQQQTGSTSDAFSLITSFNGIDSPASIHPLPDATIAAGPNSLIMVSMPILAIKAKTGDVVATSTIFDFLQTVGKGQSGGDPKIVFDQGSGRFFISMISGPVTKCSLGSCEAYLFLAVSKTSNPTTLTPSDWYLYALDATLDGAVSTTNHPDFARLGVDPNIVVIAADMLDINTETRKYPKVRIIEKSKLIKGESVSWTDFVGMKDPVNASTAEGFRPALHYGGAGIFFLIGNPNNDPCRLVVWGIENSLSSPTLTAKSTTTGGQCAPPPLAPQPGNGSVALFSGSNGLMCDAVYRNASLWMPRGVSANFGHGDVAAIRWFQIDVSSWPTAVSIVQDSTFGLDGVSHFFPSLMVDGENNLIVVYARSSSTEFPSIYYTGRLGSDPPNTLRPAQLLKSGAASLNLFDSGFNAVRYGDYFGVVLDPSNQSFWLYGEYVRTSDLWGTWVGNVGVNSSASSCSFSTAPTRQSFGSGGGKGSLSIKEPNACSWMANSTVGWITITSSVNGNGNGIVNYSVSPNTEGIRRTGTMIIGGQTFTVTQASTLIPTLLTEDNLLKAIALDSVTTTRDPFSLSTTHNFSSDQRSRLMLFAVNASLMPGENFAVVTCQAEDSQHRIFAVPVEYVGDVPNLGGVTQINIRLPDGLTGDALFSIIVRGVASNQVLVAIK